jgi:hypothetical protein
MYFAGELITSLKSIPPPLFWGVFKKK